MNFTTKAVGWTAKKIATVAVAATVAVGGGAAVTNAVISNQPMNLIANGIEKSIDKAQDGGIFSTVKDVFEGGSVEISGNIGKLTESYFGEESVDADVSVKLYTDLKKQKGALVTSVKLEGSELLDASAFISRDEIVLSSDSLLTDAYGIDLTKIEKTFDDSVFGEDGVYSLGITSDEIKELLDAFDELDKNGKDLEKVIKGIYKEFSKSVMKNAEVKKESGSLTFGDKEAKTTDVSIKVDEKAFVKILEDMLNYVKKDKKLKNYLEDHLSADALEIFHVEGTEAFDIDSFYDEIDNALDEIDEYGDDIPEFEAVLKLSVGKSSHELVGASVTVDVEDEEVLDVSLKCGPSWKDISEIELAFGNVGGVDANTKIRYIVNENTKKNYDAEFSVKVSGEKVAEASVEWTKSDGDFRLSMDNPTDFTFKGNLTVKGSKTTLVLGSVTVDEEKIDLGDITVTVDTKEKTPDAPKYSDVLTMSEEDFDDLAENFRTNVTEIAEEISDILGIPLEDIGGFGGFEGFPEEDFPEEDEDGKYDEDDDGDLFPDETGDDWGDSGDWGDWE